MKNSIYILLILFISYISMGFVYLAEDKTDEYTLKAIFFERFARLVEWEDKNPNFVIAVYGDHKFENKLDEIYANRQINKKNIVIKYISSIEKLEQCNILFISSTSDANLFKILNFTNKNSILSISEQKGFAQKGVIINYLIKNGKLKYEVNHQAAKNAGLKLSYLLLQNADKVIQEEK